MMEFTKTPSNIFEQIELIKLKGISIEDDETTWLARLKELLKTRSENELELIGVVYGWADFDLFS
jgi:hypothetical protein